jgi:hypothetical protein
MDKKSLIIGAAYNYDWNQLKYWVNSIQKTGFKGDVVIVGSNLKKETIDKLTSKGVKLCLYGKQTPEGDVVAQQGGAPHVERFFHIWNYLDPVKFDEYEYVVTTDTRDVVFQEDPVKWLSSAYDHNYDLLVCSSEGMRYLNEPWGNNNLLEAFGPFFHEKLKNKLIYNVGTIAGDYDTIRGLMLMIFQMSINRPIPIVDQAVFNFLINYGPYNKMSYRTDNYDAWAIQLGTSLEAVASGKGDLGAKYASQLENYRNIYEDDQPRIDENGHVFHEHRVVGDPDRKFVIVHQWDRVPSLAEKIETLYGDT